MVSEDRARLFRRKDNKYLIYLPKDLVEDSMFPLKPTIEAPVYVKVSFELGKEGLLVEKWTKSSEEE